MTTLPKLGFLFGLVALSACNRQRETTDTEAVPRSAPEAVAPDREAADRMDDDRRRVDDDRRVDRDVAKDSDRDDAKDRGSSGMVPASRIASATESIAEARCAREQRCNNVGADRKYSSMSDCMARVRNDWKDDLTARECPAGVDRKELDECLTAIRNDECNNPFDALGRITACTVAQICEEEADSRDVPK